MISCTYPTNEVVEQLFQKFDLFERLGISGRKSIDHDLVKYWSYLYGVDTDTKAFVELKEYTRSEIIHPKRELFADCLNEAIVNVQHHAYTYKDTGALFNQKIEQHKWWAFSYRGESLLYVVIYDLGMGIPTSLRRDPRRREYLRRIRQYKARSDRFLIADAIKSPLSATKLPYRGKGFPEMLEFSRGLENGSFSVWSGMGGAEYSHKEKRLVSHELEVRLPGTLVVWRLPFKMEEHENLANINT